jgi:hypothetical protein
MVDTIAPAVVMIVFIVTLGGVLVLRPIARRLGDLIQAAIEEKRRGGSAPPANGDEPARTRMLVESLDNRLSLIEERLNFQESLIAGRNAQRSRGGEPDRERA